MSSSSITGAERALRMLKHLPRVGLNNLRDNPGSRQAKKINRGNRAIISHGFGFSRHGHGHKKLKQHGCLPPLGFEGGKTPFYLHVPQEFYYRGFHLRRQYPPLSLINLQRMIDQGLVDPTQPIDLTQLCKGGIEINPTYNHYGINLTHDGADVFKARINIEVQHTDELCIAAVERNGGRITTSYYDHKAVMCAVAPTYWFKQGNPIPKRMLPPQDAISYYCNPSNRGYLASEEELMQARWETSQKFGYKPVELNVQSGEHEIQYQECGVQPQQEEFQSQEQETQEKETQHQDQEIQFQDPEIQSLEQEIQPQELEDQVPNTQIQCLDQVSDPFVKMLIAKKHRRQIFYGLEPGWLVDLESGVVLKPKDTKLKDYYGEM